MNGHATENVIDFRAGENGDRDARHVQKGNGRSRRRKGTPRNTDNLNAKPGRKPMPEKAQKEARELSKALRSAIAAFSMGTKRDKAPFANTNPPGCCDKCRGNPSKAWASSDHC